MDRFTRLVNQDSALPSQDDLAGMTDAMAAAWAVARALRATNAAMLSAQRVAKQSNER